MKNTGEKLNQTFLVKTAFVGLLVLLLFMSATPAKAHQVIEGAVLASNAEYVIGVKYRSFGNGPDPQTLVGLPPLGGVNQVAGNISWSKEQKNFFKFTYDPIKRIISTVIFRMDPSYKSSIITYTIPSATLNLDRLSMMKVSIACGDSGAKVALNNVKLNGTPLIPFDDFLVAYPNPPKDWTVKGFDFKNGFVLSGEIVLTGIFGTAPDTSTIALDVGFKKNNLVPVCAGAKPDPATLWPPNHDLHPIKIEGITDPDGDSVSLSVTRILQDEPLNGPGDGDFSPDGSGIDRAKAWVRSERAGGENGRVYHIYFRADDGFGGTCSDVVKVGVPKSQGGNGGPVDGGPLYNSTLHALSFSPKFLRFLYQEVGVTSIRQTVTMTNLGPKALDHIAFVASGPFAIEENKCGSTLSAGGTCTFAVTFTPSAEGIFKGSVRVTSSAADSPHILGLWGMGGYLLLPEIQGIFREGDWYFDNNQNSNWDGSSIDKHLGKFGGYSFDIPVIGDWNGDGGKKIGIYRHGDWYLDYNGNGQWDGCDTDSCIPAFGGFPWDIPVVGDWNGDGKTKIGIYRNGVWYLDKNGNGMWDGCAVDACIPAFGGLDIDQPIIGDWDGRGISRIGIYRQGFWYLDVNGNGEFDGCEIDACFGPYGGFDMDKPVVGDWKGDGIPRIGIYRQGSWYLDLNGNGKWEGCETDLCTPAFGGFAIDYPIVK